MSERRAKRSALCAVEVQVADSPLFEHAVSLLPFLFPSLVLAPGLSSLFLGPPPRVYTYTYTDGYEMRLCAALRAPRGFAPRFMRVRATTLVRALKFISVPRVSLSVSFSRSLYIKADTFTSKKHLARAIDRYRQVLSRLLSSSRFPPLLTLLLLLARWNRRNLHFS